jgi:hypothetical protein
VFIEQDGRASVNYHKPLLDANGIEIAEGEWDDSPERRAANDLSRAGKDILLIPSGFGDNGCRGPTVLVASGVPGRTLELGAVPAGGTPNWPTVGLRVGAGEVFAVDPDGTERKL